MFIDAIIILVNIQKREYVTLNDKMAARSGMQHNHLKNYWIDNC